MRQMLLAAAAVLFVAGAARAERFSALNGAKLVEICTSKDRNVQGDCTGYIEGISDTVSFYQRLRPRDGSKGAALPEYICVPPAETGVQIREKVVAWARGNQGMLANTQASGIVLRALNASYACPNEQRPR